MWGLEISLLLGFPAFWRRIFDAHVCCFSNNLVTCSDRSSLARLQYTLNNNSIHRVISSSLKQTSIWPYGSRNQYNFRSSPERWPNKPGKNVRKCLGPQWNNAATNQIVAFVKVDETFTTIWLSRSSEVRVKVRRWPHSLSGLFYLLSYWTYVNIAHLISSRLNLTELDGGPCPLQMRWDERR